MFIKELSLENFKRFTNTQIDLSSNITLLLGPNSSGKSSIIKALLGLKQTASPANEHEVFSAQGEYVDLGVFRDYSRDHDITKKIRIGLSGAFSINPYSKNSPKDVRVEFCFGYDFATEQARLLEIKVTDQSDPVVILIQLTKKKTRDSYLLTMSEKFSNEIAEQIFGQTPEDPKYTEQWVKGVSVKVGDRYQFSYDKIATNTTKPHDFFISFPLTLISSLVNSILRGLDKDFFYVGPLRRSPSRSYSRTAHLLSVGPAGEHTPSVLANLKSRAGKERSRERPQTKRLDQLSKWVESIFPGCRIDSKTVEELVRLEIERDAGAREVISDVGFGFSQVLPILVQAAVMPADTTLLIEQPELHLHPSAQTRLAEVIADASSSGRRFLVETHSEHFVRGLQIAVSNEAAKKSPAHVKLKPANVRFLYVPRSPKRPIEIEIDEWGEFITTWPSGFFDEGYLGAMKLLQNKIAATEKRKELESKKNASSLSSSGSTRK